MINIPFNTSSNAIQMLLKSLFNSMKKIAVYTQGILIFQYRFQFIFIQKSFLIKTYDKHAIQQSFQCYIDTIPELIQ